MSQQITTAFVRQYHAEVEMLVQQEGSVLSDCVRMESQQGETQFWEQIGPTAAVRITNRHGDSPQVDTPHDRRAVSQEFFDWGDFIDRVDKVQILIEPQNPYARNAAYALGREKDLIILAAMYQDARTGKEGTGTASFTAGNIIPDNFGGTTVGLTVAKLIEARRILRSGNVMTERESLYAAITALQEADLLNTTEVTSADYNSVKALVRGDVDTFLGIKFVHTELLLDASLDADFVAGGDLKVPVWAKSGVLCASNPNIETTVVRRWDKRGSWYVYAMMGAGAVRMQETKVVAIEVNI
jgi:hypothetical protein